MRRILVLLAILAVGAAALAALWIFRDVKSHRSLIVIGRWKPSPRPFNPLHTKAVAPAAFSSCDGVSFSLNDVRPGLSLSVGSTKDNQLALASSGKVFPFGPLTSASENTGEHLATAPPPGDQAFLATRHSVLSWPTPFDMNFMTGQSPSWKRHIYQEIRWKKSSGAKLQMLWRYEQFFYPGNGWASGFMTREGSTGLIRVEIKE